jgi:2-octaprenyl-6-methoxyphenol hydroxylase
VNDQTEHLAVPSTELFAQLFDVAIVGGGLVGASLACALTPLGLKVCLLEAVTPGASDQPSYDDRTLALSASSCRILQGLELWPQLQQHATAIREIQVRELHQPGSVQLQAREMGLESFGHVVEAREFGAAVRQRMDRLKPGLSLICPARVDSLQTSTDRVHITYSAGDQEKSLQARLLVGADGAESRIRAAAGIETERYDYQQTAIICNVTPEQLHRGRAFESFTPTGPFALLPHQDGRCGLVWSVASEQAAALLALDDESFKQLAEKHFGNALGAWKKIGRRSSYPLQLVRAQSDWRPRVLILGNAAHAIHPIAAQGFNLGLRDVAVLAEVLANAVTDARINSGVESDPGATRVLQTYSAWRKQDQAETIAYTDGLVRLYANPTVTARLARRAGLLVHRLSPSLRRRLAIKSMGFRGQIPKLAQGEPLRVRASEVAHDE